jgi:hypothetical protein
MELIVTECTWYVDHYLTYYQSQMMNDDGCEAVGGMIVKENGSTRRKYDRMPASPPQTRHDHAWARTRAAAVGNRRLTDTSTAEPNR